MGYCVCEKCIAQWNAGFPIGPTKMVRENRPKVWKINQQGAILVTFPELSHRQNTAAREKRVSYALRGWRRGLYSLDSFDRITPPPPLKRTLFFSFVRKVMSQFGQKAWLPVPFNLASICTKLCWNSTSCFPSPQHGHHCRSISAEDVGYYNRY